jgi:SAM-dependent methyltransferase
MNEDTWNEWRDLIIEEFEGGMTAMGTKGNRIMPGQKGLAALFLLVQDAGLGEADILPEAVKTVRSKEVKKPLPFEDAALDEDQYDSITMMGHRIGFLEKGVDLGSYFQEAYQVLRPKGQMLFTSLDMHTIAAHNQNTPAGREPGEAGMQSNHGDLLGPFFGLFHLDMKALRTATAKTNWKCTVLHQQDDGNYVAWLRHEV